MNIPIKSLKVSTEKDENYGTVSLGTAPCYENK